MNLEPRHHLGDMDSLRIEGPTIRSVWSRIIDVPTARRHRLSNTSVQRQSYVIVRVELSDGSIGHGEAATLGGPRWAEESVESIKSVVDAYLAPALAGAPALDFEANATRMAKAATRNFGAKAAVESALIDAAGHALNLPAHRLLGGAVRHSIEVIWAMASGDTDQEIEEARGKLAEKLHRNFKIKIGFQSPEEDMRRLTRLVEALPDASIVVDVNQGWNEATAKRYMPQLAEMEVDLVEQPLPAGDMDGLARVTADSRVPVMIDEGAFTDAEVARAGALHAADVLSLKLVKSGGLFNLKRAAAIATAHGLELYGGCLLESGLGAAAHLAAFSTLPALHWGTEHFGPRILVEDIVTKGPTFHDYQIHLPEGPGLGVTLNDAFVDSVARSGWSAAGGEKE